MWAIWYEVKFVYSTRIEAESETKFITDYGSILNQFRFEKKNRLKF